MLRIAVLLFAFIAYGILLIVVAIGMKTNSRGVLALAAALCTFTTACILFYGLLVSKGVSSIKGMQVNDSGIPTADSVIPVYTSNEDYTVSETDYNQEESLYISEREKNISPGFIIFFFIIIFFNSLFGYCHRCNIMMHT